VSAKTALLMGYGLQGRGALYDLLESKSFRKIFVLDNKPTLITELQKIENYDCKVIPVICSDIDFTEIRKLMQKVDIAICLLPRQFTLVLAEIAAEVGVHYACTSYLKSFSSDPKEKKSVDDRINKLESTAKKNGITILKEFGLDPGLDLLLSGEAVRQFNRVDKFISYGAGFPELSAANNPLKYKFTWSVEGVMHSYFRPASVIRNKNIVTVKPNELFLKENIHSISLNELGGVLECFPNGDAGHYAKELGIDKTVKNMGRYVCRWEGHCAFWSTMANSGFMNDSPVLINGKKIDRLSYLGEVLNSQKQFHYQKNERDVTLTRVDITGIKNGKRKRELYQIIDKKDLNTGFTSMTRCVGFVVSLGSQMILNGNIDHKGILSPVNLPYNKVINELANRNINVTHTTESLV
jgi:lysine 6-dehydrogenase